MTLRYSLLRKPGNLEEFIHKAKSVGEAETEISLCQSTDMWINTVSHPDVPKYAGSFEKHNFTMCHIRVKGVNFPKAAYYEHFRDIPCYFNIFTKMYEEADACIEFIQKASQWKEQISESGLVVNLPFDPSAQKELIWKLDNAKETYKQGIVKHLKTFSGSKRLSDSHAYLRIFAPELEIIHKS